MHQLNTRFKEALIRGAIWAFIGFLYGILFILFFSMSNHLSLPLNPLIVAGTLAGTIAALIYSSMSLAVIVSMVSSVTSLILVVSSHNHINLVTMTITTAIVGAVTGAVYGLKAKQSRIFRADAKTLTGIFSGAIVSLFFVLLSIILPDISLEFTVATLCLFTGILYVTFVPTFVKHFSGLLPPMADGAMVGAGTSAFIALIFFFMTSGVTPETAGSLQPLMDQVRMTILQTAFGGMMGGGLAGFLSGFMLTKWQDL
ncbi:MAG: hypothetical protein GY744_12760 [Gammaproteobacteria bacterium]|nr:hypothetical protein [Gammaproteobacteria bacterium]